jgi:hypothetical protein
MSRPTAWKRRPRQRLRATRKGTSPSPPLRLTAAPHLAVLLVALARPSPARGGEPDAGLIRNLGMVPGPPQWVPARVPSQAQVPSLSQAPSGTW